MMGTAFGAAVGFVGIVATGIIIGPTISGGLVTTLSSPHS